MECEEDTDKTTRAWVNRGGSRKNKARIMLLIRPARGTGAKIPDVRRAAYQRNSTETGKLQEHHELV